MEKLMNKPDGLEKQYPDEVKSDKWKNLVFTKNGASHIGVRTFNTEQEAKELMDSIEKNLQEGIITGMKTSNARISAQEYSHAIQIPIK